MRPKPNTHTWRKRRAGFDAGPTKVLLLTQAHGCETHRGSVLTLLGTGLGAIRGGGCSCSPAPVSHLSTECAGSAGDATDGRDNPQGCPIPSRIRVPLGVKRVAGVLESFEV